MDSLFQFSEHEALTFFAVLTRFSILIAMLPVTGDRFVPAPLKILLSLAITMALFPTLVKSGQVNPTDALVWGATLGGLVQTIGLEVLVGLTLGFITKFGFDTLHFGGNLVGNFMGFSMANTYDAHQETQTQVVAEVQVALATLVFLALDGHHFFLKSALESYSVVGMGQANLGATFSTQLIQMSGFVVKFGIQLAAPIAIVLFAMNVAFGIMAKAMPQMNVLVLSMSASALVGLSVFLLTLPEFNGAVREVFERNFEWFEITKRAMASR